MAKTKFHKVHSSNVAGVFYDDDLNELHVKFRHGGVYVYSGVPAAVHAEFLESASAGRFLNSRIKDVYVSRKL